MCIRDRGAAMKRRGEGDDLALVRGKVIGGILAGQLESGLIGFGPGIGEKDPFGKSQFAQSTSQSQGWLIGQHLADMPEFCLLYTYRCV